MAEFGESLSPRETDVLHEMVAGGSNKEIASALSISPNTVKVHVRNIFTKMGATSRTEAVTLGLQQGLIDGVELVEEETVPETPEPEQVAEAVEGTVEQFELSADSTPTIEPVNTQSPTVIAPTKRHFRPIFLLFPLLLILIVGGVFAYQQLTQPEIEPFTEIALEERGWWLAHPLDVPRAGMATVGDGLNIYRIGGECDPAQCDSADGIDGSTATFDSRDQTWYTLADKPTPVTDAAAAIVAGQIYVVGGRAANGATANVEVYSPAGDVWRSAASLPVPLIGAVAVSDGKVLYVVGGENLRGVTNGFQVYNPIDDSWRPLPPPATSRSYAAGAILGDSLYFVGGRSESAELDSCERFNLMSEVWESCPPLLQARAGAQALTIFDKLYVLGGGFESEITSGELFDASTDNWSVVNVPINSSWTRLGLANIETRIYLVGGERDGAFQAEVYAFEPRPFQIFLPSTRNEP